MKVSGLMFMTSPGAKKKDWNLSQDSLVYVGNSMYPTFIAPEIIYFVPYGEVTVRRGDVIVFDSPAEDKSVTHRVISVTPKGIRTSGDNNDNPDPWVLRKEDITGRVIYARRGIQCRPIYGGLKGDLTGIRARLIRRGRISIFMVISRIFQASVQLGIGRLLPSDKLAPLAQKKLEHWEKLLTRRSPRRKP